MILGRLLLSHRSNRSNHGNPRCPSGVAGEAAKLIQQTVMNEQRQLLSAVRRDEKMIEFKAEECENLLSEGQLEQHGVWV